MADLDDTPNSNVSAIAVNYVDIKLHGITNLPPSFLADSGVAPMFVDHPFRYSVEVSVGDSKATLSNGRLLSHLSLYDRFITNAALAPVSLESVGGESGRGGDVPSSVKAPNRPAMSSSPATPVPSGGENGIPGLKPDTPPPAGGAAPPNSALAEEIAAAPVQLLWALSAESDAAEARENGEATGGAKKDAKGAAAAKGKGAAAASPNPAEVIKPVAPNFDSPTPTCIARLLLTPQQVEQLEACLEQSLPLNLTFRRSLRTGCPADWEDLQEARFSASIAVPLSALKEPGTVTTTATVPLIPAVVDAPKDDDKGKKKAPAKKGKGTAPAILTDEIDPSAEHPFVANSTQAHVTVTFATALTRLPQSRPRPDLQPTDLIPTRLRAPKRPMDATKTFAAEIESLTQRIVKEYREHAASSSENNGVVDDNNNNGEANGEELRASFLNYLQSSGQAHAYKQLLIPTVQAVVKEKFVRQPNPSKEELNKVTNELYTYLTDTMHATIHRLFHTAEKQQRTTRSSLDGMSPSERWKRRAMEAEVMREYGLAAKYHQERLGSVNPEAAQSSNNSSDDSLPNIWTEYAEFSLRVRDALKAEQAYREALALDYAHLPSLIGYGLLLLNSNRYQEAEVFLQSAVDLQPNMLTWGCLALLYDMKALSLPDTPQSEAQRLQFVRESKYSITQATRPTSESSSSSSTEATASDAYLHISKHCVDLYLEDLANLSLVRCTASDTVELLYATIYYQTEQYDDAVATLSKIVDTNAAATAPRILYGDVLYAMGNHAEAEAMYNTAMRIDPFCGSGPSYVRLGNMCASLGKYRDALAAFISGAKVWPCGLTWLGVGIAYYRMEDMLRAEQALNQSNILNNLNPKTWAFIALLCLRQRREDEADQAFNQAIKQGLDDAFLIAEVGVEQLRIGRARVAEMCFRRSITVADDVNTHMQLGRALCVMKRFGEAREEFHFVASTTTSEAQRAKAEEQLLTIPSTA